ncbi:MAG: hypothetical protein K5910_06445, partial [Bacteroidales bacterium]|nr:hypothetical protein [Bacteroidales bacterium]
MKALRLITLILTLTNMMIPASAKDQEDHTLVRLWSEYYKAVDADKPKDQADILQKIKQEAADRHLAWDYYDATWKYVQARSSTNWKLRDGLQAEAEKALEGFGEPVALFYHRRNRISAPELLAYIRENKTRMEQAHNPEFYKRDGNVSRLPYHPALLPRIGNDYDYALWSLLGRSGAEDATRELAGRMQGRYPFDAFVEFTRTSREGSDKERDAAYGGYARKYAGKAVSLLARERLLVHRQNELDRSEGSSEQYRQLARDCETFLSDKKRFSGEEKAIADCCEQVEDILRTLTAEDVSILAEKGVATVTVRNLPSVRVRILDGRKELFNRTLDNPRSSFYVRDTMTLRLPGLDDGTYTLRCTGGKAETEGEYNKYTLSIAHKRDLDGYGVYVADYLTGEPVRNCDILLLDRDGKESDRLKDFAIDGFSYLPESFVAPLVGDSRNHSLQAVVREGDRVRRSQPHRMHYTVRQTVGTDNPDRHHALLLTDRSAFNPDETVQFKVLLYEGTYAFSVRPKGFRLHATLTDPTDKVVGETDLTTNEFGSAAGAFVLKKGDRGGIYTISVSEGGKRIASTGVRVDEFVLPTFELTWEPDDRFYLPGDKVVVRGSVRSYSGHSLSAAEARFKVQARGEILAEGKLPLTNGGDFEIPFTAPDTDRYFYSNAVVTVTVTDGTGETLEFNKSVSSGGNLPFSLEILNEANGHFEGISRSGGGVIVGDDFIRALFQTGYGERLTHPRLSISYRVLHEGKEILAGSAVNGEALDLSLAGHPSGLYTVKARATAVSDSGREFHSEREFDIVKASDTDTMLDLDARSFFKEIPDDGSGIALQVGTTAGPAWIVAELYGDGNRLLEKRLVTLAGVRGREGSLRTIRFERKADYPEALTLKVFWFRDGRSFEYSVRAFKAAGTYQLPLSFSRFLDTTAPHADYSFTIRTGADTEVAATIFDKSTETVHHNVWHTVTPARRSLPEVDYLSTNGTDSSYGPRIMMRGTRVMMAKAAGVDASAQMMELAVASDEEMVMEEASVAMNDAVAYSGAEAGKENAAIRENFANTIAWEPFLRSDADGTVTFNFTTADKLSTYYVQLFAHDKAFNNAVLRREMVVTLPVKV